LKKIMNDKIAKNYVLLLVVLFASELIFRSVNFMPILDWSVLRIFISSNLIALIVSLILSVTKNWLQKTTIIILSLITSAYALMQAGFNNYLGLFMSFGTSSQASAVKSYIKDYIASFKPTFYLILIPFILLIIYYIFIDKKLKIEKEEENKLLWIKRGVYLVIIIIISIIYKTSLDIKFMQNELQIEKTSQIYKNPTDPNQAVNLFGSNMYLIIDLKNLNKETAYSTNTQNFEKPIQEETNYTRHIDDTAWESILSNEKNAAYKQLHNYYSTREITPKNNYTGMFEGKNLVVIMMESVNDLLLFPEYFPNFNKIYSEGWSFTNNYSPRNSCSTANNEMSGMISLFTVLNTCTANTYMKNKYPQSMFNLFNNQDYATSSYHNYDETYYARKTIHPNMGSSAYYGPKELEIKINTAYKEWPSDVELVQKASDIFLNQREENQPFLAWLVTVSPHQPYGEDSAISKIHEDFFADANHSKPLRRYLSKLKVMDDAIGELLKTLEEAGELDDTVIVAFADHYPYGLTNSTINGMLDYDITTNNEIDRTPFVIYNSQVTAQVFDRYTTYMNILPTIANLFNLDYDPRLYAGQDLFSEIYDNRAIFANGSWQDEIAFYNSATGKINYNSSGRYTNEEIKDINKIINDKIKMSNLAITKNYFEYLYKELEKHEEEIQTDLIN